jgi:hypothetical protein
VACPLLLLPGLLYCLGVDDARQQGVISWTAAGETRVVVAVLIGLGFAKARGEVPSASWWLALLAMCFHWLKLYRASLAAMGSRISPEELRTRGWLGVALAHIDGLRMLVAVCLWAVLQRLGWVAAKILPGPLTFYSYPEPVADHGKGVSLAPRPRPRPRPT